ncbi:Protein glass, partial [Orchesella cincta]
VHTGERPFKCQLCHKSFKLAWNVKVHVRSVHENTKSFKCPFCGCGTNRSEYLDNHIRKHIREKPFECHFVKESSRPQIPDTITCVNLLILKTEMEEYDVQIDLNNVQPTGSTMAMKKKSSRNWKKRSVLIRQLR